MLNQATINLTWQEKWEFTAEDTHGHTVTVDAPIRDGDEFAGFKPTHLMMAALGACTGIGVVSILQKKRQDVTGIEIRVTGTQEENWPKAWSAFNLRCIITGQGVDPKAVHRSIELAESKYCSVGATLRGTATITTSFEIIEDGG